MVRSAALSSTALESGAEDTLTSFLGVAFAASKVATDAGVIGVGSAEGIVRESLRELITGVSDAMVERIKWIG